MVPERPGSVGPWNSGSFSPISRSSRPDSIGGSKLGFEYSDAEVLPGSPPVQTASTATQTLSTAPVITIYEFAPAPRATEVLSYSKGVQTSDQWTPQRRDRSLDRFPDSDSDHVVRTPRASKRLSRREREKEELRQKLRGEIEEELKAVKDPVLDGPAPGAQPNYPARALTDEELNAVTSSEDFLEFVERSTKVIERALDEDYDLLANYAIDGLEDVGNDDEEGIREVVQFYDGRWSKKRMISDLGFSPKVRTFLCTFCCPPLILASFQNFYWHLIPRIHQPPKIPPVCCWYGTCTFTPVPNTSSTAPLTSSPPNSHHSTPP